jgi:hypothetical protein
MALILIRAMNKKKALNVLADLERHAKLTIIGKPKIVPLEKVYDVTKRVIKQKPRDDIKVSVLVKVKEDTTLSIVNIRKTHPPAHVIVISEEYPEFQPLMDEFDKLKIFDGYYSSKKKKDKK